MENSTRTIQIDRPQKAHLVGIGGTGMRSLASVLIGRGWRLSGSDPSIGESDTLIKLGAYCFSGHSADQVAADVECLIYSSAIPPDNPEIHRAAELGIPILSYADVLGLLMEGRHGLAVAGTHGKSTVTAMAGEVLARTGCDPTVICGAAAKDGHDGGRAGGGSVVLVEACEFQQNFLRLRPQEAVILNIEHDHFDCYDSFSSLESAFACLAALLPAGGRLIVPSGDPVARRAAGAAACRIETFGEDEAADWVAADVRNRDGRYGFDLVCRGRELGRVELSVFGRHNVLNALAAAALVADCANAKEAMAAAAGLSRFRGLRRRVELLGTAGGVTFWDDYAHHPTEISATLKTIRQFAPGAPLWCLFQPHQALRTARLLDELAFSLQNAERVLVADIFRAREGPPRTGDVTAADLAARTRRLGQDVPGLHAPADIQQFLQTYLAPGDILVVMGAGDIGKIGYGLLDWFREHRAAG